MIYIITVLVFTVLFYAIYYLLIRNSVVSFNTSPRLVNHVIEEIKGLNLDANYKKYLFVYIAIALFIFFILFFFQVNIIVSLLIIALFIISPVLIKKIIDKKQLALFEKQLPDAIDLMAGALQSGSSLTGSFNLIAEEFPKPLSDEIGLIVREQKLGVSIDTSLQNFTRRMPYNSVILTVSVIRTSIETGGELSDALKNIAKTLRSIEQAEGKIKALTAQGKMQAWVVGLMPILLIGILSKMEPEAMSQLWSTKEGYIALAAIAIFEILGVIFIRKIVNIDV